MFDVKVVARKKNIVNLFQSCTEQIKYLFIFCDKKRFFMLQNNKTETYFVVNISAGGNT